jgi:hypothetical protein
LKYIFSFKVLVLLLGQLMTRSLFLFASSNFRAARYFFSVHLSHTFNFRPMQVSHFENFAILELNQVPEIFVKFPIDKLIFSLYNLTERQIIAEGKM